MYCAVNRHAPQSARPWPIMLTLTGNASKYGAKKTFHGDFLQLAFRFLCFVLFFFLNIRLPVCLNCNREQVREKSYFNEAHRKIFHIN